MGYDGETQPARGVADIGRSMLKQVSGLARAKADEAPVATQAAEATPAPANDATVISINVEMAGTIVTPDELHIAGKVQGNVRAASVTVRASGSVVGDIVAECVTVHGAVEGRIFGGKVQLAAGAKVTGDIMHGALGIDTDATFEGASKRNMNALADAPMFSAKAA